jgi:asparagine synthase (glutamine-hydrolysing)
MLKVVIKQDASWGRLDSGRASLWFKGYLYNSSVGNLLNDLQNLESTSIAEYLSDLNGHFALVFQNDQFTLIVVDRVRSIPLFYDEHEVSSNPSLLGHHTSVNHNAVLSIKMAGYTIGEDTIYSGIQSLTAGQFLLDKKGNKTRENYYQYKPWLPSSKTSTSDDLAKVTLNILEKLIASLNGRQIVIPLSAGNDSRLIASGLKHLGYKNVKCYSYGIPGNFEAQVAKIIAEKLDYEFKFIPLNLQDERKFYRSNEFTEYLAFAETFVAVPYFQSLSTIPRLSNWIDSDAVFVNGNTGDFISGGHISSVFLSENSLKTDKERLNVVNQASMDKNFSLWGFLKTEKNIKNITTQLTNEIPVKLSDSDNDHGLYEHSEFRNRQSKYVISGQRAYEFYGYEWRLPLWDDSYLEFWEKVPLNLKLNQKLYTDMLRTQNWGGVWDDAIPVNKKTIRPLWLNPLRMLMKAGFVFLGRKRWHRFETIFFYYFMDVTRMMCSINYFAVLRAALREPRHHVSWQADEYLKSKNIK